MEQEWNTCWHIDMPDASVFEGLSPDQSIDDIPDKKLVNNQEISLQHMKKSQRAELMFR